MSHSDQSHFWHKTNKGEEMLFTVVRKNVVWRVNAKSVQALTQALHDLKIPYLAIEANQE
jgi:hypothetical protein